jgi:hypothetical protein
VRVPFRLGRAISQSDRTIGVAQQVEREVELLGEVAILIDRVEADT